MSSSFVQLSSQQSERVVEAGLETRVLYDAAEGYRSQPAWHNLNDEDWELIDG